MLNAFWKHPRICVLLLAFLGISFLLRVFLGAVLGVLIRETENMASTKNRVLRQCKSKFANCFALNGGVKNVSVFVEKFVERLHFGPFSVEGLYHFSGQSMLLGITLAGVGICVTLAEGDPLPEILPYFMVVFGSLYLFFALSSAIDLAGRKRILKIQLVDYLENHFSGHLKQSKEDLERIAPPRKTVELMPIHDREKKTESVQVTEEELEALLKEFLA